MKQKNCMNILPGSIVTDGEKGLNSRKSKSEMEKSMFIFGRAMTMKFRSVIPIINRRERK